MYMAKSLQMMLKKFYQNINNTMQELSLNILNITNKSIKAGATFINIYLQIHNNKNTISIITEDNGCGMNKEEIINSFCKL